MWIAVFLVGAIVAAITLWAARKATPAGKLKKSLQLVGWPIIAIVLLIIPPGSDIRSLMPSDFEGLTTTHRYIAYFMMIPIGSLGALWCLSIVEFFASSSPPRADASENHPQSRDTKATQS